MTTTEPSERDGDAAPAIITDSDLAGDAAQVDARPGVVGIVRAVASSRWSYLIVAVWAAGWRLVSAAADHVPAYYYPDSWSYVVRSRVTKQFHPFHSPEVWRVWSALIPGVPTERSVMALHFVFGVAGAVILYHLLRRWGTSVWMLTLALIYGCLPLMIFSDRTVLSESATIFFWLLMALGLFHAMSDEHLVVRLGGAALGGLAAGVDIALRPATRYMVMTTVIAALAMTVIAAWRRDGRAAVRLAEAAATCALVVVMALPVPMRLMSDNKATWGVSTLTPGTGSVLAARWSILIDCAPFDGLLPETRAALDVICQHPGRRVDNSGAIWGTGPFPATLKPGPNFGRVQSELSTVTRDAVLRHPGLAAANVADRLRQFYFEQYDDLWVFHNGSGWIESDAVRKSFKDFDRWFHGTTSRAPLTDRTSLQRAVYLTFDVPLVFTLVLLVLLGQLLWRVLKGDGRRRRIKQLARHPGVPGLAVVLPTFAVGVATVAAAGVPDFRYWAPIMPSLMLSLGGAIALQTVRFDRVVDPSPLAASDEVESNDDPDAS